jgi:hypothetical protein
VKLLTNPRTLQWPVQAASVLVCCGFWCWASTILVPSNVVFVKTKRIPIGNNSDLYPRWLGAREVLLHNRDPYSAAVTREIQLGFYGRQIDPNNPSDPKDQVAFAYPLYVIFLFWPTTALPFHTVLRMFQRLASSLAKLTAGGCWYAFSLYCAGGGETLPPLPVSLAGPSLGGLGNPGHYSKAGRLQPTCPHTRIAGSTGLP